MLVERGEPVCNWSSLRCPALHCVLLQPNHSEPDDTAGERQTDGAILLQMSIRLTSVSHWVFTGLSSGAPFCMWVTVCRLTLWGAEGTLRLGFLNVANITPETILGQCPPSFLPSTPSSVPSKRVSMDAIRFSFIQLRVSPDLHASFHEAQITLGTRLASPPPPLCLGSTTPRTKTCGALVTDGKHTSAQQKPRQWYHRRLSAPQ